MGNRIHCLIDASGSMGEQSKYQTCLAAARSLKLAETRLDSIFPDLPSIDVWRWGNEIQPMHGRQEAPGGRASLTAFEGWLRNRLAEEETVRILLFTDGLFASMETPEIFADTLRAGTGLHLSIVGIGADRDELLIERFASSGIVWSAADLEGVLSELTGAPVVPLWGMTEIGTEEEDEW